MATTTKEYKDSVQSEKLAPNTPSSEIQRIFNKQKLNRHSIKNTTAKQRKEKLKRLEKLLLDRRYDIQQAVNSDYNKPREEVDITELYPVLTELRHAKGHVKQWMKKQKVDTPLSMFGSKSEVRYEGKGTSLIISPWNYPFNLCFIPVVSAIAAGNTAIVKPSEFTPNTSAIVKELVEEIFHKDEMAVVEGDYTVSQELLSLNFDHMFFTGSPNIGKIVMKSAAEHLASVTLELGGKSPTIVDDTANLKEAANRIAWGKFLNCGQTCTAPDYLLLEQKLKDQFVDLLKQSTGTFFGDHPRETTDFSRIVNKKHYQRIKELIDDAVEKGANLAMGGEYDESQNYIAPTILTDVPLDAKIMHEEIFGPVLPVITCKSLQETLDIINDKEKPLALYIFSTNKKNIEEVMSRTYSGGALINDTVLHVTHPNLPFGGINNSGIGNAHGWYGFRAFSHERAVMKQPSFFNSVNLMYPPYNTVARKMINFTLKWL
ncbi:MAG: aldehyde dehydrogenase family protein [Bacteroidetes bacterium SW_11_45_7]|nr:MAG: aldehyde dehydrogenase family protein [Bacteroidetes bacterium SW_11_45_7]